MKIIEFVLLFEYFVLIVCDLRDGQDSSKPYTIRSNENDHGDQTDQLMEMRPKRSLLECGIHGQEPNMSMLSASTLPGEWPWVVAVLYLNGKVPRFLCTGSLIDNRFVITAAPCVHYDNILLTIEKIYVKVGTTSRGIGDADDTRLLTAIYNYAEFTKTDHYNEIVLLVLKEPITYSKFVKPVCLWEGEDDQDDLEKSIRHGTTHHQVVGWTVFDWNRKRGTLHRVNVSIISSTACQELYDSPQLTSLKFTKKTFCAVKKVMASFCLFNIGVGLYIEQHGHWRLRGLVALDMNKSCDGDGYSIFIDVAKYRNWIRDTAYRWLITNKMHVEARAYAPKYNLSWTQQCSKRDEVNTLVAGGLGTREGDWPWHVAIYLIEHVGSSSSISYKCGGSLISASHVLTVAHCFINKVTNRPIPKYNINIYLGTHSIKSFSEGVQLKLVDRLKIHEDYNHQTQYKDIAMLRLSSPVEFTATVSPVCLWPEDEVDPSYVVGKNGSVVGWGNDEFGLLTDELRLAVLPVVSELTCVRSHVSFYNVYTNNFTLCAGLLQDTSVCNGDSGGGMVFKLRSGAGTEVWFLRGLVSLRRATDKPCDPSQYVIFTDVAKYLDWIKDFVSLYL